MKRILIMSHTPFDSDLHPRPTTDDLVGALSWLCDVVVPEFSKHLGDELRAKKTLFQIDRSHIFEVAKPALEAVAHGASYDVDAAFENIKSTIETAVILRVTSDLGSSGEPLVEFFIERLTMDLNSICQKEQSMRFFGMK